MKRISLRSLFVLILASAVVCTVAKTAYDAYVYRTKIMPAWEEFPVSSEEIEFAQDNDIKIYFEPGSLDLSSNATLIAATEFNLRHNGELIADGAPGSSLEGCYDLYCELGTFRLIFIGGLYANVTKQYDDNRSPFHVLRESVSLRPDSQSKSPNLWDLRRTLGYYGDGFQLHHFQSDSKMGFITNSNHRTTMEIFDGSGVYCCRVLPISPIQLDWSSLAGRIVLIDQKEDRLDNQEIHRSSVGQSTLHKDSTNGTR